MVDIHITIARSAMLEIIVIIIFVFQQHPRSGIRPIVLGTVQTNYKEDM